jgi:hypothetical protein
LVGRSQEDLSVAFKKGTRNLAVHGRCEGDITVFEDDVQGRAVESRAAYVESLGRIKADAA